MERAGIEHFHGFQGSHFWIHHQIDISQIPFYLGVSPFKRYILAESLLSLVFRACHCRALRLVSLESQDGGNPLSPQEDRQGIQNIFVVFVTGNYNVHVSYFKLAIVNGETIDFCIFILQPAI